MSHSLRNILENKSMSPHTKLVLIEILRLKGIRRNCNDLAVACGVPYDLVVRAARELQRCDITKRSLKAEEGIELIEDSPFQRALERLAGGEPIVVPPGVDDEGDDEPKKDGWPAKNSTGKSDTEPPKRTRKKGGGKSDTEPPSDDGDGGGDA